MFGALEFNLFTAANSISGMMSNPLSFLWLGWSFARLRQKIVSLQWSILLEWLSMTGCKLLARRPELSCLWIVDSNLVACLEPWSIQFELFAERVLAHDLGGEIAISTLLWLLQSLVRQEPASVHLLSALVGWKVMWCILIGALLPWFLCWWWPAMVEKVLRHWHLLPINVPFGSLLFAVKGVEGSGWRVRRRRKKTTTADQVALRISL